MNLANIVMGLEEDAEVVKSLKLLKDLNLEEGESKVDTFVENCRVVEEECAKGMAEKVLAEKHDGYKVLVQALKTMPVRTWLVHPTIISDHLILCFMSVFLKISE